MLVLIFLGSWIRHEEAVGEPAMRPLASGAVLMHSLWGWLCQCIGLYPSIDFSSSGTGIHPFVRLHVSLPWMLPDTVFQLWSPWLSFNLSSHVLSALHPPTLLTHSLETENHPAGHNWTPYISLGDILSLAFHTARVLRTPNSLPQPLSFIFAFCFLEITTQLDSLHLNTLAVRSPFPLSQHFFL